MSQLRSRSTHLLLAFVLAALSAIAAEPQFVLKRPLLAPNVRVESETLRNCSVATDGKIAVVGLHSAAAGAPGSGVVKVYDVATGVLSHTLTNPGPVPAANFGKAVSISGTRVVVGAHQADIGAKYAGTAYVFDLASPTPTRPVLRLENPSPGIGDAFGCAVAVSGKWAVVGAYADDVNERRAGSAFVYDLASPTPSRAVVRLIDPEPLESDRFGSAVAISGTRVVVGAWLDDTKALNAGSAFVFDIGSRTPTVPIAILNSPEPKPQDYFGTGVAISGTKVAVGAPYTDAGAEDAGCVYVYDLANPVPTKPVTKVANPIPAPYDYFGYSVALSGQRLVVGAHLHSSGARNSGSAYVYDLTKANQAVLLAVLTDPKPAMSGWFGLGVAVAGETILIGLPYQSTSASSDTVAYLFGRPSR